MVAGAANATLIYFRDFEEILVAVECGAVEAGVVPVENSLEGAVTAVMDLLLRLDVVIAGELNLPISSCLIGSGEGEIKIILSHPQALAQCRQYLREHYPGLRSGPPAPPATLPAWPRSSRRWRR